MNNHRPKKLWHHTPSYVVTADIAADRIIRSSPDQQAAFFICCQEYVAGYRPGNWQIQCREIASMMTDEQCLSVRQMLHELTNVLEATPLERAANADE